MCQLLMDQLHCHPRVQAAYSGRREGGGSIWSKIAERLSAHCDSIFTCLSFIASVAETDAAVEAVGHFALKPFPLATLT